MAEPPPFQQAANCAICNCTFGTFRRKHHCRECGRTVCAEHGSKSKAVPQFNLNTPVRVCDECYDKKSVSPSSANGAQPVGDAPRWSATSSQADGDADSLAATLAEARLASSMPPAAAPVVDCTCGMPLCICEAPPKEEAPSGPSPSYPSPPVQRSPRVAKAAPQTTKPAPASGNEMPSLFFQSTNGGTPEPSSKPVYEESGEGLREAVKRGDASGVRSLLAKGVEPSYVDRQGMSLLHLAAMFNQTDIAFMLIDAGASVSAKNGQGETPLDCAPATLSNKIKEKLRRS
ncbi:hypothetical protein KFL_002800110 [Klebsormidium nitens]|uniref:FYVE-type domain-containing protein n=1 Tax=Klebsormidium nitens TaxID=105231 RepID=A0A1Y1IAX8_KLENI|nr:hypothetical protein KFL_002800110 [Klebsormidium nitens]|eukprot:GAQ86281.1 hypothetical protein KFL_002800110 [Klebsormidium nitens]